MVQTLPGRDVSSEKLDKDGQTPLFWAITNEHKGVIALLWPPEPVVPNRHKGEGLLSFHRFKC